MLPVDFIRLGKGALNVVILGIGGNDPSDDETVATIDDKGLVTAIQPGKAAITATTSNNKYATTEIIVVSKTQTDVPVTDAPVTDAPVTEAPVTDAPVTDAPVTDAPVTDAPVPAHNPGDVDGDGDVDLTDVFRILQYESSQNVAINTKNADVNGDA